MKSEQLACPHCGCRVSTVYNTRAPHGGVVRRRRVCEGCKARYSTLEIVALSPRIVTDAVAKLGIILEHLRRGNHE